MAGALSAQPPGDAGRNDWSGLGECGSGEESAAVRVEERGRAARVTSMWGIKNITFRLVMLGMALLLTASVVYAGDPVLRCGMAEGYPPYQYVGRDGQPAGIDVEVARLLFAEAGLKADIEAGVWDDMVASLRLGRLDCVIGMEINEERRQFFDFTAPYYNRKVVLFVRRDDESIRSVRDLEFKAVAGDRHSFVEHYLQEQGLLNSIRIIKTKTKEQSMRLLKEGTVVAIIAPKAVGLLLASEYGVPVRVIDVGDPGSPVGFAVEKGNIELRNALDRALGQLERKGAIKGVLKHWLP